MIFDKNKWKNEAWFNYAVAICIGILFYMVLSHLYYVKMILSYIFKVSAPLIIGICIAYLVEPICQFFYNYLFRFKAKYDNVRRSCSIVVTYVILLFFLFSFLYLLIPQVVKSAMELGANWETYVAKIESFMSRFNIEINLRHYLDVSRIPQFLENHASDIVDKSTGVSFVIVDVVVGIIFAVYVSLNKIFVIRFLRKAGGFIIPEKHREPIKKLLAHTNKVFTKYVGYNIFEAVIVGLSNFIFMLIIDLPYNTLISVIVGVTNIVPTFGPMIGAAIACLLLLLERPRYVIWFGLFTLILQTIDGYILKPKLYGSTLGVPSILILTTIILGGKMFGVAGMLLAIPLSSVITYIYTEYFMDGADRNNGENKDKKRHIFKRIARENSEQND